MLHPYSGLNAVLTTKHEKLAHLSPAFTRIGVRVDSIEMDTDLLGTFAPEIPRTLSQRETVLAKARLGMAATGSKYGIATEASIGPDSLIPFLNSIVECVAWVDDLLGIEILNFYRSLDVVAISEEVFETSSIEAIITKGDFPNHGLIVYAPGYEIFKGIREVAALEEALRRSFASAQGKQVIIESDLRAHMSPSRQRAITHCAKQLVDRLESLCPECETPGFGVIEILRGLPCEECRNLNAVAVRGEVLGCAKCDFRVEKLNGKEGAAPVDCGFCNP